MSTKAAAGIIPVPTAGRIARPRGLLSARSVGDASIYSVVFVGGFVLFEPSPYELLLIAIMPLWLLFGLKLRGAFGPLIVLLLVYMVGGLLSLTQLAPEHLYKGVIYMGVSLFLCLSAIWWAALLADDVRRAQLIERATIAIAVIVATIGILGYFRLLPSSDLFLLYGRARGTFQDPNVFGPFLLLPILLLARRLMVGRVESQMAAAAMLVVLLVAVFLSFSRAAWGTVAVGLPMLAAIVAATLPTNRQRLRLAAIGVLGLVATAVLVAVLASIPAVTEILVQRAKLVQDYDGRTGAHLGRFARHAVGFMMATEKPLGIGPFEFPRQFVEATHNSYLKGLMEYGWIGFVAYTTLVGWTLAKAGPLLIQPRPWQGLAQCVTVAFVLHLVIGWVIDTDHWRHFYLLVGLIWGLAAAERYHRAAKDPVIG